MEQLDTSRLQYKLLREIYKINPFDLRGDLKPLLKEHVQQMISCLIIASNRSKELDLLLEDLLDQTLERNKYEVIVLNDGAGRSVKEVVDKYRNSLNIIYKENQVPHRIISDLRNMTIEMSQGSNILFLDDDTRIFQKNFLAKSLSLFDKSKADIILIDGNPLYGLVQQKYCYLDQYSFANRCCLYRRNVIEAMGGFRNGLNSYEDIELSIRLNIHGFQIYKASELTYFHPPLYFDSMRKPLSIGQSIFQMRSYYSFLPWLLVYLNALRFLPFGVIPKGYRHQWFKISLGVLLYPFTRNSYYY